MVGTLNDLYIFKKITEKPERAELLFRAFYKNHLNGFS